MTWTRCTDEGVGVPPRSGVGGFEELVQQAGPRLYRTALLLSGDHHLAEDLTQTALAKVFALGSTSDIAGVWIGGEQVAAGHWRLRGSD